MCGEILSADEVERLLNMIEGDRHPSQPRLNFTVEQEDVKERLGKDRGGLKYLDRKRS